MPELQTAVDAVKARTKRARARGTVDLPLPIYEGQFAGRFGVLDPDRLDAFVRETMEVADLDREDPARKAANLEACCSLIADACRTILARTEQGGRFEPLTVTDSAGTRPVRFDQDFAEALGLELDANTREAVVRAVWTLDDGSLADVMLNRFAGSVLDFSRDTTREVEDELAGESLPGPR
jgi:hypothetical protein